MPLPTCPVYDADRHAYRRSPVDLSNQQTPAYVASFAAGKRAAWAREDRATLARLRDITRDEATRVTRINLARSVGDPWGALGTRAIDGIPEDGRPFAPGSRTVTSPDALAVDAAHRAALFGAAQLRLAYQAWSADAYGRPVAAGELRAAAASADRARAHQHADYEFHAGRAYQLRRDARRLAGAR